MALTYKVMCIQGIERATITKEFDAGEVVDGDLMTDEQLWPHALELVNQWNRDAIIWNEGVLWHYYLEPIGLTYTVKEQTK